MQLKYTLDTDDTDYAISAEGDTNTGWVTIAVISEGDVNTIDMDASEARELAAEIVSIANRLDPLEPSLAAQLDVALKVPSLYRAPIQPCGTTGF